MADDSKFEICSRACILVGGKPIAAFDDSSTEALVARNLWDPRVRELLTEHDWRFCQNMVDLVHLAAPPMARWTHAWALPPDFLKLLSLTVSDTNLTDFQIAGREIHCDLDENHVITLEYLRQVTEDWFPPYFTAVLEERLSADFAGVLREDAALAGFHRTQANTKLMTAKRLDRLNQPARKFPVGRIKRARL